MRKKIIRMNVNVGTPQSSLEQIMEWSGEGEGRYVCVSNVHMCMEVYKNDHFGSAVNDSDLVVADGKPIVWAQRALGGVETEQVRGADLTLAACNEAAYFDISVYQEAVEANSNYG